MTWLQCTCIAISIGLSGCVSVSVPTGGGKKAEDVVFAAPAAPFREFSAGADRAWLNDRTGNTISFLSECGGKVDPSLEQLKNEAINVLVNLDVKSETTQPYNGRQARLATVAGQLDGVPVMMKLVTLKKNSCNYILTYTGVSESFAADESTFEAFLKGFRAP